MVNNLNVTLYDNIMPEDIVHNMLCFIYIGFILSIYILL
jgi:hypothetical protein